MGNWSTLNKGVTASTKDAVEIQVEQLLEAYQNTLKYHQQGQLELAKQKYKELVSHALVEEEPKPKQNADLVEETPLATLRFLVFKNYASILEDEFERDPENIALGKEVLNNFLRAIKIDPTDYTLWFHIGHISHTLKKLRFARLAYETGFYVNSNERTLKLHIVQPDEAVQIIKSGNFTPMQWKCLEGLCTVLYDIGDYRSCKSYVDIIMSLTNWDVGLQLQNKMRENENTSLQCEVDSDESTHQLTNIKSITITLEKSNWLILVESLLKEYRRLVVDIPSEIITDHLADTFFVNRPINITVEREEEEAKTPIPQTMEIDSVLMPPPSVPVYPTESEKQSSIGLSPSINSIGDNSNEGNTNGNMVDGQRVNPNKRKREENEAENEGSTENNSGNESGSENDEESEAEEKRLSLRASKRQLEKIANEETSRLKMLEEEKEFINKVQSFYDKTESITTLYREKPWYTVNDNNHDSLHLFWEWFDHKISELDSGYCWDIDTSVSPENLFLKTDSSMFGDNKMKNLTLFNKSATVEHNEPSAVAVVKDFIIELNSNNSGITDSLCKLISVIVYNDNVVINNEEQTISTMSNKFIELMTDTITILELNLVESILSNSELSENDKIMVLLRVCEYIIDRLIRNIMIPSEETGTHSITSSNGKRRVSTTTVKISKINTTETLMEQCQYWVDLLERIIFSSSLNTFFFEFSPDESNSSEPMSFDHCIFQLRYWSLKGKLAQCDNDISRAYAWYVKTEKLLESSASQFKEKITINIKSMYDATIDLPSIRAKLNQLQVGKLFVTSKQKLILEKYEDVIEDLEPVIKPKLSSKELIRSNEMIQMTNMLARAYTKTNKILEAWNCYSHMFCYLMKQLVDYGRKHHGRGLPYLSKNEDVGFFKLLSLINSIMDNLISLMQQEKAETWLPIDINIDVANSLSILLRMSIYYIFRHPDFVPLVNNFSTPDTPPHTPSKITKSNGFNDIMIKAWVLQSYLIQHTLHKYEEHTNSAMGIWAELLKELHDELGEREVCGAGKRIFLSHLMNTLTKSDDTHFRRDIYQCYHCLYGVHLAAESDIIEEHHCIHSNLDQKASEPLFELVVDSVVKKLEQRSLLKTDLKDVIDTVSELFEELPTNNPLIESNKIIIEAYLNSDLKLHSSIDSILRTSIISATSLTCEKAKISKVYYKIFWIRGKTLRLHLKNKLRPYNERVMAELEKAVEEFTSHLILNPDDVDGWCELGACFQLRAEIELDWSANNIVAHKDVIGEYQKKSYHAYLRGLYLANARKKKELAKDELFANFGNMAYIMASSPMNMESFKAHNVKHVLGEDGKIVESQNPLPSSRLVYKLAIFMYNQALRYKIPDNSEWGCYYMMGKCSAKSDRPAREVLEWLFKATCKANSKSGKNEHEFEPIYTFYSYIVKYYYRHQLSTKDADELLAIESTLRINQLNETELDQDVIFLGSNNGQNLAEKSSSFLEELRRLSGHLHPDNARVYNSIFVRLFEMQINDSKNTQHRHIYRMSWMYYHIYNDAEKAKSELMKLFNFRVLTKSFINIWKPGFELAGRHYKYISKYTLFLIDLAKATTDTQTLKYLCRKVRRAPTLVLNDKEMYKKACIAYFEAAKSQLRNVYHAKVYMKMIKESKIDKSQFEELCIASSAEITADKSIAHPDLYAMLQDIAEIKRSLPSYVVMTDDENEGMDKVIRMCYAVIILGGVLNDSKCDRLATATVTDEEAEIQSRSRKDLRIILLAQAKLLMQTMVSTSK